MAKRTKAGTQLAEVRELYKRACIANCWARHDGARKEGLADYFYFLKHHWLCLAIWRSFPDWQEIFGITVDHSTYQVEVSLKDPQKGLHLPARAVEEYFEFLSQIGEDWMLFDLKEIFEEALLVAEKERWDAAWETEERIARRGKKRKRRLVWPRRRR